MMKIPSRFKHPVYALLIQGPTLLFNPWLGAAFASAWFISREHAQRENQIARDRMTRVEDLKWWEGFTGWERPRHMDAWPAVIVTIAVAILV